MPPSTPTTDRDRAAWTRLWQMVRDPWERDADLAEALGVSRTCLVNWASGTREGPWGMLRGALRRTARRFPDEVPAMIRAVALELFDAEGRWVPVTSHHGLGSIAEEFADVTVAGGRLIEAVHNPEAYSPEELRRLADDFIREAYEAEAVALRQQVAQ